MDIENLSKTDLILTAAFLSFITAIVTGIVVIFLMEDAPKDIIRERIITQEATTTPADAENNADATSTPDSESTVESSTPTRDEILEAAVRAVARITADGVQPQAGVLIDMSGREVVITAAADYSATAQALFEDGTVADLESVEDIAGFSVLSVIAAGDYIYPLEVSTSLPEVGASAFVVPLSARPEIVRVSVTSANDSTIKTSAATLPAGSLLLGSDGRLIGLYMANQGSFQHIIEIERGI